MPPKTKRASYGTEQGYFIPAAAFEAAEHAPVWGFCEDGIYPMPSGEFAYGAQIKLRGTVYADCFIESISAELVNAQGETVACTENTYSTYFDLVQMEDALFAQALADGEYTLSVTAYSGAAAYTIETQFVILPPVWGDVSGDGAFNFNDVAALSLYLLDCSEIELPYMRLADYNGDGVVNYADLTDMYIALLG